MVVHMVALLIMALIVVTQHRNEAIRLFSDRIGDPLALDDLNMDGDDPTLEPVEIDSSLPQVTDPFAAPPPLDLSLQAFKGFTPSSEPASTPQLASLLSGREPSMQQALRDLYGGDALTDDAVIKGLAWLAKQQQKNGSWSLRRPYTAGSLFENRASATAMALLAFLGNGNTHVRGTYKTEVDKGVNFLLDIQKPNGDFFEGEKGQRRDHWLYTHGQCTIAICELYAMTRDTRLAESAQRAVKFAVGAQYRTGGWRYRPATVVEEEADTSVSGWVMMGLQSAKMAGLEVPKESLERFSGYLDTAQDESGWRYGYLAGQSPDTVMTAEALLCRQYLGWSQSDPRLRAGAAYLTSPENLPTWEDRDVYYWYYATQMLHHMEGTYWPKWNDAMKPILVKNQVTNGPDAGSWHPLLPHEDRWGAFGGRLYVTCLSIYILEVYYRHLPLYKDPNEVLKREG
ncbi:MAG: terpene cyclase/mutase family protein [Planctomycetes bacterium]|nr:terpene cyclase/mutase family protein [Planctomycetota bacterium]